MVLKLVVKKERAVLLQIRNGRQHKVASFSADGVKWWHDAIGAEEIDDRWQNHDKVSKAVIFAKVYPYTKNPHRLVRVIKEMEDFEAIYWHYAIEWGGVRAVAAFKKLFGV